MGTNYYLCVNTCKHCGRGGEIHIGKSSGGWKFLFRWNPEYYQNMTGLRRLTRKNTGNKIIDGNGEQISHGAFWKLVEEKQNQKSNNTGESCNMMEITVYGYEFWGVEFS